jgi:flagellar basal body-associated protein FliL
MSEPTPAPETGETKAPRFSRRWLLAGAAGLVLLLAAGGWFAWSILFAEAEPEDQAAMPAGVHFIQLPDVTVPLTDLPHLVRLGLVIEVAADTEKGLDEGAQQRLIEEIRRWLATQALDDLHGAAALWTVRSQTMALMRDLYPDLPVRDVLIRTLILQ